MIYWILIFSFLCLSGLSKYRIKQYGERYTSGRKAYVVLTGMILVILAGLRSTNVGADTSMYKQLFDYAGSMSLEMGLKSWQRGGVEIGYYVLEYFFSHYLNFQLFLMFCAIISIVPVVVVIYKYSSDLWFSLFLYISFGFFSFAMGGIRQAIAIGFCMIAYIMSREKKLILFLAFIILAMLFHLSAVVFIPVYWVRKIPYTKLIPVLYIIAMGVMFIIRLPVYNFLSRFARQAYTVATDQGGFRMFLFLVFIVVVGWICTKHFFEPNTDNIGNKDTLLMVAVATLMWPVANLNAELNRMYYYYQLFMIIYIPEFLKTQKRMKLLFYGIVLLVSCYYLYSYIINGNLKYAPYSFYWSKNSYSTIVK